MINQNEVYNNDRAKNVETHFPAKSTVYASITSNNIVSWDIQLINSKLATSQT